LYKAGVLYVSSVGILYVSGVGILFYTYKNIRNVVFKEEPVIYSDQVLVLITIQDTTLVIEDNV